MDTYRFGRKLKIASTFAIKHQIRKLMAEDAIDKAGATARAAIGEQKTQPLVQAGYQPR